VEAPTRRIAAALVEARREVREPSAETEDPPTAVRDRHRRLERALASALEDAVEIEEFLGKLTAIIGRHAAAPTRVSVPRLLAAVRAAAQHRHSHLDVRVDPGSGGRVVCHPEEIAQVLAHLIENADEAMGAHDTTVTLRSQGRGGYLELSVEDRGPGLDARTLRQAFEPFFSTKNGHDGLGLYFCRLIAERNSGSIELRRLPGGGTRAAVVLPVVEAPK
jgi:signal transduction histidine kinase